MKLTPENFRKIIFYNFQRGLTQQRCLAKHVSVFGDEAPCKSSIKRLCSEFQRRRGTLIDDPKTGLSKTIVIQENIGAVHKWIMAD